MFGKILLMKDSEGHSSHSLEARQITPEVLRVFANQAELDGDWDVAQLLEAVSDKLIRLEAQNQAYRHALSSGVSIKIVSKKRWYSS